MPGPTFSSGYVKPGPYILQQDVSNPVVPQNTRIPAAIGQGSKTLVRSEVLVKGALNGQDGPLSKNVVIDILSIVDQNNVAYTKGVDFKIQRPTAVTAKVDWSLKAALTGSVDLTTVTYPGGLDGKTLRLVVNGGTTDPSNQAVVFTNPADKNAVVNQINAWDASLAGVASLDASNHLVLTANSIVVEEGDANSLLGFLTGDFAAVQEPAVGLKYQVVYVSDKADSEYAPQLFSNMNDVISYHGALKAQTLLDSGTVSAAASKSLTNGAAAWTVDAFVGCYVKVTAGPGKGQVRVIVSNTATVLTLSEDWSQFNTPTAASTYSITDVNNNSITLGAKVMFDAGATFVITSQYADDLFDSLNIKAAIDALQQDVKGFRPECLVLMRGIGSTETSIVTYLKAHVDTMSGLLINKFRVAVIGLASGNEDFSTFVTFATGTKERRVTMVNISTISKDFGAGLVRLDGSYVAAGYAGVYCANVDAGEPITRKSLGSVFDVDSFSDPFLDSEKDQMAAAGVTIVERQGLDIRIRHALTTDPSTIFTWEAKLTRSADFISNVVRQNLESLTGRRFTISPTGGAQDVLLLAKSNLTFLLESLKNPAQQIITGYSDLSVTQNPTVKQQIDIRCNIFLTTDVVWEFAILGFAV